MPVKPTQRDKAMAMGLDLNVPEYYSSMGDLDDLSMPDNYFESISTEAGKGSLPQMQPDSFHMGGLMFHAYMLACTYVKLEQAWRSIMAPVGCLLAHVKKDAPPKQICIVLYACEFFVPLQSLALESFICSIF